MTAFSDLHMDTIVEEDELSKASQIRSQSRSATINTYDSAYEGALLNLHSSNSAATNSAQTASQKSVRQADKKTQTPTSYLDNTPTSSWNFYSSKLSTVPRCDDLLKNIRPSDGNKGSGIMKHHWCFCGNSIRFFILILSFLAIGSLFANLLLFNIAAIIAKQPAGSNNSITGQSDTSDLSPVLRIIKELFELPNQCKYKQSGEEEYQQIDGSKKRFNRSSRSSTAFATPTPMFTTLEPSTTQVPRSDVEMVPIVSREPVGQPGECLMSFLKRQLAFVSPAIVILLAYLPCSLLMRRFGAYAIVAASLAVSGLLTAAFPFMFQLEFGYWWLIGVRVLLSIFTIPAFILPSILSENWAVVTEQLFFIVICFLAFEMGPFSSLLGFTFLGFGTSKIQIIAVFVAHALFSCVLIILWLMFYRDAPSNHRLVYGVELNRIMTGKSKRNRIVEDRSSKFSYFVSYASACSVILITIVHFVVVPVLYTILGGQSKHWICVFSSALIFLTICLSLFLIAGWCSKISAGPCADEFTLLDTSPTRNQDDPRQTPTIVLLTNRKLEAHH